MNDELQLTSVSPEQMQALAVQHDIPIETSENEARMLSPSEIVSLNATTISQVITAETAQAVPVADVREYTYAGIAKNGVQLEVVLRDNANVKDGDTLYAAPPTQAIAKHPDDAILSLDQDAPLAIDGTPIAWVRFCSDGRYEGPIMDCDKRMDGSRRSSGVWTPLFTNKWLPIKDAPEGELVVALWMDSDDQEHPERHNFDYLEDGVWQNYFNEHEHYLIAGVAKGRSEDAPYTHYMPLPAAPSQGAKQ